MTSDSVKLTVLFQPTISTQPQPLTVLAGAGASFSVTATSNPVPTYQWQKNGTDISNANSDTFKIAVAQTTDSGTYRVIVRNSQGNDTSSGAKLTVNTALAIPTISTQPQPLTVLAGAGATFSVAASGNPVPTYQWQKNGTDISNANSDTFKIAVTQTTDSGTYRVIVRNSQGNDTSTGAKLTVNPALVIPTISIQPRPLTVFAGGGATFSVVATGYPLPTYQWQKNGTNITNIANATTDSLKIPNAKSTDAGTYRVIVSNSKGNDTSNGANLTVNPALGVPTISTQPQALTETVGSVAIFSVVASGNPVPTYQWQKNGTNITNIANATTDSLKIPNVQSTDAGTYRVIVSNSKGNDTSNGENLP